MASRRVAQKTVTARTAHVASGGDLLSDIGYRLPGSTVINYRFSGRVLLAATRGQNMNPISDIGYANPYILHHNTVCRLLSNTQVCSTRVTRNWNRSSLDSKVAHTLQSPIKIPHSSPSTNLHRPPISPIGLRPGSRWAASG